MSAHRTYVGKTKAAIHAAESGDAEHFAFPLPPPLPQAPLALPAPLLFVSLHPPPSHRCRRWLTLFGRGKQDVLMVVVPSSPPVVAITCTTDLSLYFLDGTPLPAIPQSWDPLPVAGDASPGGEEGGSSGFYRDSCAPQPRAIRAEAHQRDIRCLAGSPAGDMVATG